MRKPLAQIAFITIVCAIAAIPVFAAAAFVQANTSEAAGTQNTIAATFGSNTTSGNAIVACVSWDNAGSETISSIAISSGSASFTNIGTKFADFNQQNGQMAYALNITGGTTPTITVTFTDSQCCHQLGIMEISGLLTSGALDQTNRQEQASPGTGTDAVTSPSVTTTTNGQFIFGCMINSAGGTPTLTQGTNYSLGSTVGNDMLIEYRTQASAGSIAATFTRSVNGRSQAHISTWIAAAAASDPGFSPVFISQAAFANPHNYWKRNISPHGLVTQ